MEIDEVLRIEEPPDIKESSTQQEISKYERWKWSNRLSLMFMKSHIIKGIRGSILECTKAKVFLKSVEEWLATSNKALANTLMKRLSSKSINNSSNVCGHIMEMRDIAAQLKSLEVEISDLFLVHLILNSLPVEYGPFKISYNTHKEA